MATWSSQYVNDLPDSAFACPDSRTYPHHDSSGELDLSHLRAALSRVGDTSNEQCGKAHLQAHAKANLGEAKALMPIKAKALDDEMAWFAGKIPRRLLAIPFGGPIPSPKSPLGVDYDGEWFSDRTDIFGGVRALRDTRERLVDFSHAFNPPSPAYGDPTGMMNGHILGKSILDPDPEEDGWWVDLWLKAGDKRVRMIQALAQRGAQLFGSSQVIPGKARHDPSTGEILAWPWALVTLSPAPSNTYSVLRPAKAVLEEADLAGITVSADYRALIEELRDLDSDLRRTSLAGDDEAKGGQAVPEPLIAELGERVGRTTAVLRSLLERLQQKD